LFSPLSSRSQMLSLNLDLFPFLFLSSTRPRHKPNSPNSHLPIQIERNEMKELTGNKIRLKSNQDKLKEWYDSFRLLIHLQL
jgi:hypothetical protein